MDRIDLVSIVLPAIVTVIFFFAKVVLKPILKHRSSRKQGMAQLREILDELPKLKGDLMMVQPSKDPLTAIVHFFNITSVWHDKHLTRTLFDLRAIDDGRNARLLGKLEMLAAHIKNAGRDLSGWNRTKVGETVTVNNVFLGNIYGLWTKPVSYWMTQKDSSRDSWKNTVWEQHCGSLNSYEVVSLQAILFITEHRSSILEIISEISDIEAVRRITRRAA